MRLLVTARLRLVPWTAADIDLLHEIWTDPGVRRFLWDDVTITRETAAEVVHAGLDSAASGGFGFWMIREGDEAAGFCGFRFTGESRDVELLFGLLPRFWGRGLATEAARAALDEFWSETKFDRVRAMTDRLNVKSAAVMRRLGMRHESTTQDLITYVLDRPEAPAGRSGNGS